MGDYTDSFWIANNNRGVYCKCNTSSCRYSETAAANMSLARSTVVRICGPSVDDNEATNGTTEPNSENCVKSELEETNGGHPETLAPKREATGLIEMLKIENLAPIHETNHQSETQSSDQKYKALHKQFQKFLN